MKLKLGKGSSFVKRRLQRYPQEDAVWEADFQPFPDEQHVEFWLGMVVDQEVGVDLVHEVLDAPPIEVVSIPRTGEVLKMGSTSGVTPCHGRSGS